MAYRERGNLWTHVIGLGLSSACVVAVLWSLQLQVGGVTLPVALPFVVAVIALWAAVDIATAALAGLMMLGLGAAFAAVLVVPTLGVLSQRAARSASDQN